MKVCVAGTFNIFHRGHRQLFTTAFEKAGPDGTVYIGVTEGNLLWKKKFSKPCAQRIQVIKDFLKQHGYERQAVFRIIEDKYDISIDGDFDAIIVSPETVDNATDINKIRKKNVKKPLEIIQIPHVLADDGKPISSTRIYNREIDSEGKIIEN